MQDNRKTGIGGKVLLALTMIFFYLPILYIIVFSFNGSRSLTHLEGFSLRWYEKMFADSNMMEAVVYTIVIAVLATVISTIAGTLAAIGMSRSKKILRNLVDQVNNLPILNPEIVTAIGLLMFFSALGVKKGFVTLLLAHIMFCIPYVILSVMPKLRSLDPNLADAAMDLGATPFQALTKVIVPQILPGIISGALVAFTMSFDDFIISYFVTGNGVQNISILVYTMSKRVNPSINALSTLVIVLITAALTVVNVIPVIREKQGKSGAALGKRGIAVCMAVVVAITGVGIAMLRKGGGASPQDAIAKYGSDTLKLYIPGEYMSEELIPNFEKEYGVKVIVELFDSNEMMYTKLQAGDSYDVVVPSDYMIQRMLADAEKGLFDMVVVKDISRFARNTVDLLQSVRKLKSLGIETQFLTANMTSMGNSEGACS